MAPLRDKQFPVIPRFKLPFYRVSPPFKSFFFLHWKRKKKNPSSNLFIYIFPLSFPLFPTHPLWPRMQNENQGKKTLEFTWNSHLWDIIKQTAYPFVMLQGRPFDEGARALMAPGRIFRGHFHQPWRHFETPQLQALRKIQSRQFDDIEKVRVPSDIYFFSSLNSLTLAFLIFFSRAFFLEKCRFFSIFRAFYRSTSKGFI